MSENHATIHEHHHHHGGKNLKLAFVLNSVFTVIEIIGGLLTNSMAILSDALHDMGDSLAIGLALYFERLARRKRDQRFSYGYKRVSLLSALINAIILLVGSVVIIYESIPRLSNPEEVNETGMLILAVIGVLVNGFAMFRLKSEESSNQKVVRLHLLEDVLGWIAVLIGSLVMMFFGWPIIDPLLSLAIAVFILWNVFKNLREFIRIFLQGIPRGIDLDKVSERVQNISGVKSVHDLHIWSMDGNYDVFSAHIVVEDGIAQKKIISIKSEVKKLLKDFGINHETIEIDFECEVCDYLKC